MFESFDASDSNGRIPRPSYWNDPSYRLNAFLAMAAYGSVTLFGLYVQSSRGDMLTLLTLAIIGVVAGVWLGIRAVRAFHRTRRALIARPDFDNLRNNRIAWLPLGLLVVLALVEHLQSPNSSLLNTLALALGLAVVVAGAIY